MRRLALLFLLLALPVQAQEASAIRVLERRDLALPPAAGSPSRTLALTLVHFRDGGWAEQTIVDAASEGARILAQCGVALSKLELVLVDAPARYRYYWTPLSRALARALALPRPAVYFVAGTRQNPPFDAEAIGRGNLGARPELRDTVWIARGASHLGVVFAHELAHVLMDSGEHPDEPANLMRDETAPENTRLSPAQCARLRDTGTANGLLQLVR